MGFLTKEQLSKVGLKDYGDNVFVSDKASIYNPHEISLGSNIRIDDFCILSGNIELGNYIHISAYCALYGKLRIRLKDFSGLSPRCTIFSATDDFSGEFMINPMVPIKYTNVSGGMVTIGKFCQVGAGSIVLPDITLNEGSVVGAMSLVNRDTEAWSVNVGCPSKKIKDRKKTILELYLNV